MRAFQSLDPSLRIPSNWDFYYYSTRVFLSSFLPSILANKWLTTGLNCILHFLVVYCSKCPLQENAYEKIHVYVAPSTISPFAGEGLFARKTIKKGQLISLFNGIRWRKGGRRPKAIQAGSEDWSDYRLTLGMYLKIPNLGILNLKPTHNTIT